MSTNIPFDGDPAPNNRGTGDPISNTTSAADLKPPMARAERVKSLGDSSAPIVMMFGPANSGKTVALLRLARYLDTIGMEIVADVNFRADAYYEHVLVPDFQQRLADSQPDRPANNTDPVFIALDVREKGVRDGRICKFIEVPGEHLFEIEKTAANQVLPAYIEEIFRSNARKIVLFMVPLPSAESSEAGALSDSQFREFCDHVVRVIENKLSIASDDFIFVVSKADMQRDKLKSEVSANVSAFRKALMAREGFSRVAESLRRANRDLIVVPYSAGTISQSVPGKPDMLIYSKPPWPAALWREIRSSIGGTGAWGRWKRKWGLV